MSQGGDNGRALVAAIRLLTATLCQLILLYPLVTAAWPKKSRGMFSWVLPNVVLGIVGSSFSAGETTYRVETEIA